MHYFPCCQTYIPLIISPIRAPDQSEMKGTSTYKCNYDLFFKMGPSKFSMSLFSWIWRRLCLVLILTSYNWLFYFGNFGWSANALVVLLLFIQILYNTNSAIIQFTLADLKGPNGKYNLHCGWKQAICRNYFVYYCDILAVMVTV